MCDIDLNFLESNNKYVIMSLVDIPDETLVNDDFQWYSGKQNKSYGGFVKTIGISPSFNSATVETVVLAFPVTIPFLKYNVLAVSLAFEPSTITIRPYQSTPPEALAAIAGL